LRFLWLSEDHADTGYYLLRVLCLAHVFDHTARVRMCVAVQSAEAQDARLEHLMDMLRRNKEDLRHLRTVIHLYLQHKREEAEETEEMVVVEEAEEEEVVEDTDAINPSSPYPTPIPPFSNHGDIIRRTSTTSTHSSRSTTAATTHDDEEEEEETGQDSDDNAQDASALY
jgi:hypothetical protein